MSSPLEKFIQENRDQFDDEMPDPKLWDKIRPESDPEKAYQKPVRFLPFKRWLTVAAALVCIAASGYLYSILHIKKAAVEVVKTTPAETHPVETPATRLAVADSPAVQHKNDIARLPKKKQEPLVDQTQTADDKEMYYYAKLIEIKQEELKTLEKDEPLLYKQFAGDVEKLDKVYHSLKTRLPDNSNRELVMEAMIANLQLQIKLLNKQLKIIKQIKHSKKSAYENAYKTI